MSRSLFLSMLVIFSINDGLADWVNDPTFTGGDIKSFAVRPDGEVLAGTYGGVFSSTNNGATWTPRNAGLSNKEVNEVAAALNGNIYAGTERGFFRSSGGLSWEQSDNGITVTTIKSVVSSIDGTVFCGTAGGGVFRSTDFGSSWVAMNNGLGHLFVKQVVTDDFINVFALTEKDDGVYRSTDNGMTWENISSGLGVVPRSILAHTDGRIFLSVVGPFPLYVSTDYGDTWLPFDTPDELTFIDALQSGEDEKIYGVEKNIIWEYENGMWEQSGFHEDYWAQGNTLVVLEDSTVLVGSTSRLRRREPGGGFRNSDDGMTAVNVYRMGLRDVVSGRDYFIGTGEGRVAWKEPEGQSWKDINIDIGESPTPIKGFAFSPGATAVITQDNVFFTFDDSTSENRTSNLPQTQFNAIVNHDGLDVMFLASLAGVYRSFNWGNSWEPFNDGLLVTIALDIEYDDTTGLLFITSVDGIYESDGEKAWTLENNAFFGPIEIAINPTGGDHAATALDGLVYSWDGGGGATALPDGWPDNEFSNQIAISPSGVLSATTVSLGVFWYNDTAWVSNNVGIEDNLQVNAMIYLPLNPHRSSGEAALLGTFGGGLFTQGLTVDVEEEPTGEIPADFRLAQNYPNPFNPATTISFTLPVASEIDLRVFNLIGEDVGVLASGKLGPGRHSIQWDASGQPSGVYFYRLRAGEFVKTRKLVLVR